MSWLPRVEETSLDSSHEAEAELRLGYRVFVPENAWYFEGHFPDSPIVPGFVLLSWVVDLCSPTVDRSVASVGFLRVSRISFGRPVRPGAQLLLEIDKDKEKWSFSAKECASGDRLFSGIILTKTSG